MPAALYLRHPASLEHDTGAHPERAERIRAIEAALAERDWLGYEQRLAPEVDAGALARVHEPDYIERIQAISDAGGGFVDPDTMLSPGSWGAALHAAGAATAAVDALLGGEAGVAFCGVRPPGHHALAARAMGFCLFNNVAVAARHALDQHGAGRVLVLDWDVHHGNGTVDIFYESDEVLAASIHQLPLWPGSGALEQSGAGAGEGFTLNLPVPPGSGEDVYLALVADVVAPVARSFEPGLLLVSAGYDAHRSDPLADIALEDGSYRKLSACVRALAAELGVPLGFVLEGGYDLNALTRGVLGTMEAATSDEPAPEPSPHPLAERAREHYGRWWEPLRAASSAA